MNSFKVSLGSICIIQFVPTFLEIPKAKSTMILDASVLHRHHFHESPTSDMIEDHTEARIFYPQNIGHFFKYILKKYHPM